MIMQRDPVNGHMELSFRPLHWSTLPAGVCFTFVLQGCEPASNRLEAYTIIDVENQKIIGIIIVFVSINCQAV